MFSFFISPTSSHVSLYSIAFVLIRTLSLGINPLKKLLIAFAVEGAMGGRMRH